MAIQKTRIAITGYGMRSAFAGSSEEQLDALWEGQYQFKAKRWGNVLRYVGICQTPQATELLNRKHQKYLGKKDQIAVATILDAFECAGLADIDSERLGLFCGAGSNHFDDLSGYFPLFNDCIGEEAYFDSQKFGANLLGRVNPLVVTQTLLNNALCFGSRSLAARGANTNLMSFENSGLDAIGLGASAIRDGRVDVVVAGGIAPTLDSFSYAGEERAGLAAPIEIGLAPGPYDRNAVGAILGEGSAFVVLEREDAARKRGAEIFAVLGKFSQWSSAVIGEKRDYSGFAERREEFPYGFVYGVANGVRESDQAEQDSFADVPMVSVKGSFGECFEASPVMSLIAALRTLEFDSLPPQARLRDGETDWIRPVCQSVEKNKPGLIISTNRMGQGCSLEVSRFEDER